MDDLELVRLLRAKRFHETTACTSIALNVAYNWISNYGRSIARPFCCLIVLTVGVALPKLASCWPWACSLDAILAPLALSIIDAAVLLGSHTWPLKGVVETACGGLRQYGVTVALLAYLQSIASLFCSFSSGWGFETDSELAVVINPLRKGPVSGREEASRNGGSEGATMSEGNSERTIGQVLKVNLNANGVVGPALAAMRDSLHVVALSLDALTNSDLRIVPDIPRSFTKFSFAAPANEDLIERRATLTRWLISKGIQELARGIRQSLEEGYLYVNLSQMPDGPTTVGQFNSIVSTIRRKAGRAKFPELMQSVSAKLVEPLTFEQEFLSLQKVRNCLEHRGGDVGRHDMGPGGVRIEKDHLAEVRRGSTERTYEIGQRIA